MADIMTYESLLPRDFDGTFKFTNWTDEEFVGTWGKKEYHFPPKSTSPLVIPEHTPREVQQIRKKFAKDLAEREFYKSPQYSKLFSQERNNDGSARLNGIHSAGTYSLEDLTPYIQKCLEPLSAVRATITETETMPLEAKLTKDEDGALRTEAIDRKMSLKKKALDA